MEIVPERDAETYEHYDRWKCFRCGWYAGRAAASFDYELTCPNCHKTVRLTSRRPREQVLVLDGMFAPPDGLPTCEASRVGSRMSGWECVESEHKYGWTFIPERLRR